MKIQAALAPILCLCAAPLVGQSPIYTLYGANAGDNFGVSVAHAGDVNRDRVDDIIVGIWGDNTKGRSAGAAKVISGKTGTTLYTFFGKAAFDGFGISVSGAGDVNLDGFPDVIVGSWGDDTKATDAGAAVVFSGKTGTILFTFLGDSAGDRFGVAVSAAGDVDRDGFADVIVGAHKDDNKGTDSGSARVFAGRTGQPIWTFNGNFAGDQFGQSVGYVGDINNDGHSEVIVGAFGDDNNGTDAGTIRVFSGKDAKVVYAIDGDSAGDGFGDYVAFAGDVNNDGTPDFIVGACQDDNNGTDSGSARVFNGKTGKAIWTFNGAAAGDAFGYPVGHAGDVNKDGYADLIIGAYGNDKGGTDAGMARVHSGKDGKVLHTFLGSAAGDDLGIAVSAAGDVNGDGYGDVVVGADLVDRNGLNSGRLVVHSGTSLSLTTDTHTISLAKAGSQTLSIAASKTHAQRLYWLFGSFTGTSPGTPLGNVVVPLNYDVWTLTTFTSANTPLLRAFKGTLDASGQASAVLTVPANQPSSLVGLTLHHAFVVYDTSGFLFMVSNPVPMTLLK